MPQWKHRRPQNSLHHTEQVTKQCQKGKQEITLDGYTAFGMHQSDYSLVQCSEKRWCHILYIIRTHMNQTYKHMNSFMNVGKIWWIETRLGKGTRPSKSGELFCRWYQHVYPIHWQQPLKVPWTTCIRKHLIRNASIIAVVLNTKCALNFIVYIRTQCVNTQYMPL
jgi:hypothetical protein